MAKVTRIEKWWNDLPWYGKLAIVFGVMTLLIVGMIVHYELTSPDELISVRLPGTQNETQLWEFEIDEPGNNYVLTLYPDIADGWGSPKIFVHIDLIAPDKTKLIDGAGKNGMGGSIQDVTAPAGSRDVFCEGIFPFSAPSSGIYSLRCTVLSEHVESVRVSLGLSKQKTNDK